MSDKLGCMEKALKNAAEINIYERNKIDRTTENTDIVEELVQQRQKLRDKGNHQAADWMTKTIRKQVKMRSIFIGLNS